ncbi:MAG: segregation/condensation protein A [Alphaproteobacteria bacterium]|nr:segregation/condensation protein A [Alphaproteobacteria bacterium]MBO6629902.1 segregation/condensation protein A [Alphaproteobacteria bacterium]MDF1624949.1 ScpA family protein [Parvibaculaceae bacterium]
MTETNLNEAQDSEAPHEGVPSVDAVTQEAAPQDFEEGVAHSAPAETIDALIVDLDGFEGPLDVLLALARNQKVDLAKISILPLAEQYLEFINQARRLELDLAADYLVMAAWLAFLKSKLLLPPPEEEDAPSGEEMAARLAFQLRRLEGMRNASAELQKRLRMGVQVFPRGAPEGIRVNRTSVYVGTLYDLLKAYSEERIRALKPTHMTIKKQPIFAIEEARHRLQKMLGIMIDWGSIEAFLPDEYATPKERRTALASTFSASLEFIRDGHLEVQQGKAFEPIFVRKRATPRVDLVDDFGEDDSQVLQAADNDDDDEPEEDEREPSFEESDDK